MLKKGREKEREDRDEKRGGLMKEGDRERVKGRKREGERVKREEGEDKGGER